MPILSQYWFSDRYFGGPFENYNQPYPSGGWAWISNSRGSRATLSWNRPDNETIIDFAAVLANPFVTSAVDGLLTGGVSRTGPIQAQGVFWPNVPYYGQGPGRHNAGDLLVRVYIPIHISTPRYCTDADGTVSYWLVFYLDGSGMLHGYVDGWSYEYDGGGPFCTDEIDDGLDQAVPAGIGTIQNLVDTAVARLAGAAYSTLYYLPGSGSKATGGRNENANTDVALVLLP
ncbi:hypothetical protein [Streptomyces coeruleorubidus]|uniref:Uncharacterized protein n=1 Tax=Streptomyces coeruleorubidus TaxID=116188 RepID=A0ABZ0K3V2_STRC4|nr:MULTISPECIES: hypothetical protein [Streptomyces]WOT32726.1 hypothetical protein R5U08_00555 [Streptomyces coeruleorubidus]GGU46089.1 hypothetical protein GCM10010244_84870 [Streptomyces bellus]